MNKQLLDRTLNRIQKEYLRSKQPWILGYSGGKDSSALVKLVMMALKKLRKKDKIVTIVYCDSCVEIPIFRDCTYRILEAIKAQATRYRIPIDIKITYPKITDRFFVNVIGKGYPTPTNKFRWCTDRLKIKPISDIIEFYPNEKTTVLLGIRNQESHQRDRILKKHQTRFPYYFKQAQNKNTLIYSPIVNYTVKNIWHILLDTNYLKKIDFHELAELYNHMNGKQAPIEKGNGRFGCWICTVIRNDKMMENMIRNGFVNLEPMLLFKKWLMRFRDRSENRNLKKWNGRVVLGSFTLEARKLILSKLLNIQKKIPWQLICNEELTVIKDLWRRRIK